MRKRFLILAILLAVTLLSRNAKALSCYDECYQSYQTCPTQCLGTPAQCSEGYQVCVDSCNRGVGPWLIC